MLASLVIVAQLTVVPLAPPPPTVLEANGHRIEIVRDHSGKVTQLLVRRQDGKRMTDCPGYWAIQEWEYRCPGWGTQCGSLSGVASGADYGSSASEACDNAAAAACGTVGCSTPSSQQFCNTITSWVGIFVGESGGNCQYAFDSFCGSGGSC